MRAAAKLTVATTFPLVPARGGGQLRVLGLYAAMSAAGVDVDVVTLGPPGHAPQTTTLRPGLREIRVPKSGAHHAADVTLSERLGIGPVDDVGLALHHHLTPAYAAALAASAAGSQAVVSCHPYAIRVALAAAAGRPVLYEAQDVEADLKAGILGEPDLVEVVREHEGLACTRAAGILACSASDAARLVALYGTAPERVATVPNGLDVARTRLTGPDERAALRRSVGVDRFTVVFVGSWHGPNIDAARALVAAAERLPSAHVLVVGSAGDALGGPLPPNVDVTGAVAEGFVDAVLAIGDVAANPVTTGSGTNLKMLAYAAAGIPIVSTSFGARGLGLRPGEHYATTEADGLVAAVAAIRAEEAAVTDGRVQAAARHVRTEFDWHQIAAAWLGREDVRELLGAR